MQQPEQNSNISIEYIKQKLLTDPDFIKKSKINYFDCTCKGLHEGEKLVLVCLENECKNKGLICPVCRQENHKNHQVVHLKIFLGELQAKLLNKQQSQQGSQGKLADQSSKSNNKSLAGYLSALETARKNIMTNLQESVKTLAQSIKEIEKRIQEEYIRIRRIILSQKSFENKLPKIYTTLLGNADIQNEQTKEEIKEQIRKLTELLHKNPKQNKIKVAADIDNIVDVYIKNSDTCTTHLLGLMTDLPKKFTDLPIKLKNIADLKDQNKGEGEKIQYKFSQDLKAASLLLSENKKNVSILGPDQIGGLAFLEGKSEQNSSLRKVNLKIVSSVSDSISLGVGDVNKMKQISFIVQQLQYDGLYGICAMGIDINDVESPTFVFSQGDVIEISYDCKESKIIFERRNGVERQQIELGFTQQQSKRLKFFTSLLLYGDCVEIVE